ncbi:hypothetical protein [Streptomyces niveus]|uniref:hypothetical protein n=1 Tax=Streptomyces niveus TaxID=193462 RepID=UPI0003C61DCC|nr:hypothetical protein [Streptomyces niveus]EST23013.1 hypothetical protein M877_28250 [Streptomyces niveus NCIMB 11891]
MQTGDDLPTAVGIVANLYRTARHHQVTPVDTASALAKYRFMEKPPFVGPQPLPTVDYNGPMWTPDNSVTSTVDARQQQARTPTTFGLGEHRYSGWR